MASEVRSLAAQSREAASEISELAANSINVADYADVMLEQLVPGIQHTATLVQEISAASREQDSGAGQINRAIQQMLLLKISHQVIILFCGTQM